MRYMLSALLICILLGLWFTPTPVLAEDKMVQLSDSQFVDLYVRLSLLAEKFLSDTLALHAKQDTLFKKFNLSQDQFLKFKEKYDREPEKYKYIWQDVIKRLEEEENKAKSSAAPPAPAKKDK